MRTIGVVTTSRADFGIYVPLLRRLRDDPGLRLQLFVTGMHLARGFGDTGAEVELSGFPVAARVPMLLADDAPAAVATSMGLGTIGMAQALAALRPDLLVVLGDRFEMHAAAVAAVPLLVPLAHVGGGAVTLGAIDDGLRHSMTKLAHLHFVETAEQARRLAQMGEEEWRISTTGALGLDNVRELEPMPRDELEERFGLALDEPPVLVTFHPVTRQPGQAASQVEELLAALASCPRPLVFTCPNADAEHRAILGALQAFVRDRSRAFLVPSFGVRGYVACMRLAAAMVGNSSSGIIEAASFELPVVDVGERQAGRLRSRNVVSVPCEREAIRRGLALALDPTFRRGLAGLVNPYGDGGAAERIHEVLAKVPLDERLRMKRFVDREAASR